MKRIKMQKANPIPWFSKITTDEYNEAFQFLQQADGLYWKVLMAAQARASRKNNKLTGLDECEFYLSQTETRSFGLEDSQHGKLYRVIKHLVKLNFLSKVGNKTGSKNAAVYRLNKGFMGLLDFQIGSETDIKQVAGRYQTGSRQVENKNVLECKRVNKNDQTKEKKEIKKEKEILILPDFLDEKLWNDFINFRISIKAKMTHKAKELAIKKLTGFHEQGENISGIIEQSIMNGYKGLFLVNKGNNNGRNSSSAGSTREEAGKAQSDDEPYPAPEVFPADEGYS